VPGCHYRFITNDVIFRLHVPFGLVSNNQEGKDATCKIQILELGSTDSPEQFDTLNLTTNVGDEPLGFLGFVFDMDTASEGGEIFLKDAFWSEGENLTVPES